MEEIFLASFVQLLTKSWAKAMSHASPYKGIADPAVMSLKVSKKACSIAMQKTLSLCYAPDHTIISCGSYLRTSYTSQIVSSARLIHSTLNKEKYRSVDRCAKEEGLACADLHVRVNMEDLHVGLRSGSAIQLCTDL